MTTYIALLRAVNVGGTGKLPMADLIQLCQKAGFQNPRTYIASGNVLFHSPKSELQVQTQLQSALEKYADKPIAVLVRTAAEMAAVLQANPFPNAQPNRTVAIFLNDPPPKNTLQTLTGQKDEVVRLGTREIYVHYGDAMATSKLKIPAAKTGTARNLNTIAKLAALAASSLATKE